MENYTKLLSNVTWYDIDKDGYINKSLKHQAAVYIYIYMKISLNDSKACYYVGSTICLIKRISYHRSLIVNWDNYEKVGYTIFYKSIKKHGWLNFKFSVLEYVDLSNIASIEQNKKTLLLREQHYLDNMNPSLNTYKKASSPLRVKGDNSVKISKSRIKKKS